MGTMDDRYYAYKNALNLNQGKRVYLVNKLRNQDPLCLLADTLSGASDLQLGSCSYITQGARVVRCPPTYWLQRATYAALSPMVS